VSAKNPDSNSISSCQKGTALVTGGSSGIGEAYARKLAGEGYDLILTGRDFKRLISLANQIKEKHQIRVDWVIADLTHEKDVRSILELICSRTDISILINNAGYGSGQCFDSCRVEDHLDMLKVHISASIRFIHAVLPQMIKQGHGTIINVSSMGAFTPAPGNSIYGSSKLFLIGFTESLQMELIHTGVKIQCLCPGYTRTRFQERRGNRRNSDANGFAWMEPEEVVNSSVRALKKGRTICIPGYKNRIFYNLLKWIPRRLYRYTFSRKGLPVRSEKSEHQTVLLSGQTRLISN